MTTPRNFVLEEKYPQDANMYYARYEYHMLYTYVF
jgi:hypothetical protein